MSAPSVTRQTKAEAKSSMHSTMCCSQLSAVLPDLPAFQCGNTLHVKNNQPAASPAEAKLFGLQLLLSRMHLLILGTGRLYPVLQAALVGMGRDPAPVLYQGTGQSPLQHSLGHGRSQSNHGKPNRKYCWTSTVSTCAIYKSQSSSCIHKLLWFLFHGLQCFTETETKQISM